MTLNERATMVNDATTTAVNVTAYAGTTVAVAVL